MIDHCGVEDSNSKILNNGVMVFLYWLFWLVCCLFWIIIIVFCFFFFFQAEDGIRDGRVTGVQTCALPIFLIQVLSIYADASTKRRESRYPGFELVVARLESDKLKQAAPVALHFVLRLFQRDRKSVV